MSCSVRKYVRFLSDMVFYERGGFSCLVRRFVYFLTDVSFLGRELLSYTHTDMGKDNFHIEHNKEVISTFLRQLSRCTWRTAPPLSL